MVGARVDQIVAAVLTGMGRTVVRAGTESERHSDTLAGLLEVAATEQLAFLQREASLPAVTETLQGRVPGRPLAERCLRRRRRGDRP